ncbi:TetR/AcrR family transcriptional regulator [Labrenzia sp. VG12]|uniref:TetR/AcrR family transcriptional regulator n=1 Tax=Labrenzia sp. VG12 TaxID=2021862 RepID=UPI000B8C33C2|nr:TetR/AcrR family transcriptional regulator [Labrenzia sp. VG12]ASP32404.1 TetR family transcriptional regulator [Labrenzia sp. VG12]
MSSRPARKAQDSKSSILDAALDLIRRAGAPALTIDAVAEAAGFSKGGVLYNFPTKDALITGMVEHLGRQFEAEVIAARAQNLSSPCPTLSAMIDVTEGWLKQNRDLARAMLATTAAKPDLSEPFMDVKARLKAAIQGETPEVGRAWAIWASLEGLHFAEAHCVAIFNENEQAAVFEELRSRLSEFEHRD